MKKLKLKKPFLIGEIGINHNGSLKLAKKLIDQAKATGFDAVKFQKRSIDKVYSKEYLDSPRESPWGSTQRQQKEGLEFGKSEYDEIEKYCKKLNILWSASAWDLESQKFLRQYNLSFNKLASPMLGNMPLVKMIAKENIKTFISTGMSTLEEIRTVVKIFEQENCPFELMHCNSTYPLKDENANLLCISNLKNLFKCNVGYSGHETSLYSVCLAAVVLGATSIERHITLDRSMYGSDQSASVETHALKKMVDELRNVEKMLGNGEKVITESEITARKKLRVQIDE